MATSYIAQINQSGLQLNFIQPSGGVSFLDATCFLLITDSNGIENSYPCQIDPSNTYCFYILNGTEFTEAGPGIFSLQIQYISGSTVLYSPITSIKIVGNLNG